MASSQMITPKITTGTSIDVTILETPVPQASSTVNQKKSVNSSNAFYSSPSKLSDKQMVTKRPDSTRLISAVGDINKLIKSSKDHNDSLESVSSSLGLLGTSLSDFSVAEDEKNSIDELIRNMKVMDRSINLTKSFQNVTSEADASHLEADLRLRMQRALAVQTLERSSTVSSSSDGFSSKKSSAHGDVLHNLSQLSADVSFHENRISSHSTDFSDADDEVTNPFSKSELAANASLQSMFSGFESVDFISPGKMEDRLRADEISWKKAFGSFSSTSQNTCFSGIVEDEVTVGESVLGLNSARKKVSADEFFSLKTHKIGSLHSSKLDDNDRPSFGNEICSPIRGRKRVPLIDLTGATVIEPPSFSKSTASVVDSVHPVFDCESKLGESICSDVEVLDLEDESNTTCSIPSVTQIQRIMSEDVEFSPHAFIKNLMKCSREPQHKSLKDTSNIQLKELQRSTDVLKKDLFKNSHLLSDVSYIEDDSVVVIDSSNTDFSNASYIERETLMVNANENNLISINKSKNVVEIPRIISNRIAKAEDAQIALFVDEQFVNSLDFGTLPEHCIKCYTLTIVNLTNKDLPLMIFMNKNSPAGQYFYLNSSQSAEKVTSLSCLLHGGWDKPVTIELALCTPTLKQLDQNTGFVELPGQLSIALDIPNKKTPILKNLPLRARVGMTSLLLRDESPIDLVCHNRGESVKKTLPLKNGGLVPLYLKLVIIDRSSLATDVDGVVTIDKEQFVINVDEIVEITVTYHSTVSSEHHLERTLIMELQPQGQMFELVLNCSYENWKDLAKQMPIYSSGSSGSDRNSSCESSRSSASGSCKWPVVTTSKQLIWSSLHVGKTLTQSCTLRNEHTYLVQLQMILHDPANAYKLLNERGEFVNERTIILHSMECLTFTVMFCPVKSGAAFAKVQLRQLSKDQHGNKFAIPLCGYGGSARVTICHIPKDKTGYMWLSLGPLDTSMEAEFTLTNKGSLEAFAIIKHVPRGTDDLMQSIISIKPSKLVIGPGCSIKVLVTYHMKSDDIRFLASGDWEVYEIGALKITSGDEATRHRIRRIKNKWQVANELKQNPKYSSLDLDSLCAKFPEELAISDVSLLSDPNSSLSFLYRTLQQQEVGLTVEKVEERTLVGHSGQGTNNFAGNSILFQSLYSDNVTYVCESDEDSTLYGMNADGLWHVSPPNLTLMLPEFSGGCITIINNFQKEQLFEVHTSDSFLTISPTSDIIPARGEAVVTLSCSALPQSKGQNCKGVVKILLENDVKIVMINIHNNIDPHKANTQRHAAYTRAMVTPSCLRQGDGIERNSVKSNSKKAFVSSKKVAVTSTTRLTDACGRKLWK